jgi:hypothetical protein
MVYDWYKHYVRDRPVAAGQSQLLSDYPLLDVLLDACHGVEGLLRRDFDYDSHMSLMRYNLQKTWWIYLDLEGYRLFAWQPQI